MPFKKGDRAAAKEVKADAIIQIRIACAEKAAWQTAAAAHGKTLSAFIAEALKDFIKKSQK